MSIVRLESEGQTFDLTHEEANNMLVIADAIEGTDEAVASVPIDKRISPAVLGKIVAFIKHHQARPMLPITPFLSARLGDYMSEWDLKWVTSMDHTLLKGVITACHMLDFKEAKSVCLYRLLIDIKNKVRGTMHDFTNN